MLWLALASSALAAEAQLRVGIGLPDVARVHAGVSVSERWSVHGTLGTNLGLITYFGASLGGRWDARVWEFGPQRLVLGVGPDIWFGPAPDVVAVIANASVEFEYSYDFGPVGLVVAHRLGMGPTMDFPSDRFRVEPAGLIVPLQLGLRFGSR